MRVVSATNLVFTPNSTFAYVPSSARIKAFRQCRELLWALDVAWVGRPEHLAVINFLRFLGEPVHMSTLFPITIDLLDA